MHVGSRGSSRNDVLSVLISRLESLSGNCLSNLEKGLDAANAGDLTVEVLPVTDSIDMSPSDPQLARLVEETPRLADLDPASFDALVVVGGQSPMFTFRDNDDLKSAIRVFYESEKPTAALCHGVAALVDVTLSDGSYLIEGKTMTGFSNGEEAVADAIVGQQVMPWHIEDAARERGANYVQGGLWKAFAVRDGRLITGQQQYSGAATAKLVIEALGR